MSVLRENPLKLLEVGLHVPCAYNVRPLSGRGGARATLDGK
jgi:hypothetical protein